MKKKILIIAAAVTLLLALTAGLFLYRESQNPESQTAPEPTATSAPTAIPTETPEPTATPKSSFTAYFFDVGEADCSLVECDGEYMLIDGGNAGSSDFLFSYLKQNGIEHLKYIVCTHAHADHAGGLAGALNYAEVDTAFAPVEDYDNRAFESFKKYLGEQGKSITIPTPGDTARLGSATITFLAPLSESEEPNNTSIMLRIEYGDTSFLFTGDAERDEEIELLRSGRTVRSTLLKVGHHGSDTSSCLPFVTAVDAQYAIISVGEDNEYGHPNEEVLQRLSKSTIYRTDINGDIVCRSNGTTLTFETEH